MSKTSGQSREDGWKELRTILRELGWLRAGNTEVVGVTVDVLLKATIIEIRPLFALPQSSN